MITAIAITPIWDDAIEKVIDAGSEFKMTDDRVNSLIAIGAAKLPEAPAPQQQKAKIVES